MIGSRLVYVTLFVMSAAAAFAKALVYAWMLAPGQFGLVTLVLLITSVGASLSVAGIYEGLSREVPLMRGLGQGTAETRANALCMSVVLALTAAVLLTLACFEVARMHPEYRPLLWAGPVLVSTVVFNGVMCDLQIREHSTVYAAALCAKNLLTLLVAIPLGERYGADGVLGAEVFVALGAAAVCLLCWSRDLGWSLLPATRAMAMIRTGLPFAIGNAVQNLGMNIDRWAVQLAMGVALLGAYSFAMHFATVGMVLVNMVSLYAAPRAMREFGQTRNRALLLARVRKLALLTIALFAVGAVPYLLLFPMLVRAFFPDYEAAVPLVLWIYLGTAGITVGFHDILFRVVGDGRPLVAIQAVALLAAAVACGVLVSAGAPLVAYAIVFAVARIGVAAAGWWIAVRRLQRFELSV